jgi:hypothetical protein
MEDASRGYEHGDFWDQDWRAPLFASASWRQATIPILTLIE